MTDEWPDRLWSADQRLQGTPDWNLSEFETGEPLTRDQWFDLCVVQLSCGKWTSNRIRHYSDVYRRREVTNEQFLEAVREAYRCRVETNSQGSWSDVAGLGIEAEVLHLQIAEEREYLGQIIDSHFQIEKRLITGGLGLIYLVRDLRLERTIALKQIHSAFAHDDEYRWRFHREARITSQLDHPGVVPIYGLSQLSDERPFYFMRLIHGKTLTEAADEFHQRGLAPELSDPAFRGLLSRFVTVCNTLAYAHSKAIIHRDVKPQNIMVGPFGETLMIDWGLARSVHTESDTTTQPDSPTREPQSTPFKTDRVGTPGYMSPEQDQPRSDEPVGPATDIYALGMTLLFLLTNREFPQKPSLPKLAAPVPKPLLAICNKALQDDPNERYANALELARDVEAWLADSPISVFPDPITVRIRRQAARHKTAVTGFFVLVFSALIALGIGFWAVNAEKNETQAVNGKLVISEGQTKIALADSIESERKTRRILSQSYVRDGTSLAREFRMAEASMAFAQAHEIQPETDQRERYWHRVRLNTALDSNPTLLSLSVLPKPIQGWAVSGDGDRIVFQTSKRTLRTFSTVDGTPIGPEIEIPDDILRYAINHDGTRVAIISKESSLFETETGTPYGKPFSLLTPKYCSFAQNGRDLYVLAEKRLVLWTPTGPKSTWPLDQDFDGFSQYGDGRYFVFGFSLMRDQFLYEQMGNQLVERIGRNRGFRSVSGITVSPDQKYALAIKQFDAQNEVQLLRFSDRKVFNLSAKLGLISYPFGVFSPNSDYLVIVGESTSDSPSNEDLPSATQRQRYEVATLIHIPTALRDRERIENASQQFQDGEGRRPGESIEAWYRRSQEEIVRKQLKEEERDPSRLPRGLGAYTGVQQIRFTPDGTRLIGLSYSGRAYFWDVPSGFFRGALPRTSRKAECAVIVGQGERLLTVDPDQTLRIWGHPTKRTWELKHDSQIEDAIFSPDSLRIASSDVKGRIKIWKREEDGTFRLQTNLITKDEQLHHLQFANQGDLLFSASASGTVQCWDVKTGQAAWTTSLAIVGYVELLTISQNDRFLAIGTEAKKSKTLEVHVLNRSDGRVTRDALRYIGTGLRTEAFGSQTGLLIGLTPGQTREKTPSVVEVTNFETNEIFSRLKLSAPLAAVTACRETGLIATADDLGSVITWSSEGVQIGPGFQTGGQVRQLKFDPTGQRLFTTYFDKGVANARVWSVVNGQAVAKPIRFNGPEIWGGGWSHDGGAVVATAGTVGFLTRDSSAHYSEIILFDPNTSEPIFGPIWLAHVAHDAIISPDRKYILWKSTLGSGKSVWIRPLDADTESVSHQREWAEILSGQRWGESGVLIPLDRKAIVEAYQTHRKQSPDVTGSRK